MPGALAAGRGSPVGAPGAADADVGVEAVVPVAHAVDRQGLHRPLNIPVCLQCTVAAKLNTALHVHTGKTAVTAKHSTQNEAWQHEASEKCQPHGL